MPGVAVDASHLRSDAARNRALVLDAAARLIADRGIEVTMQEIASAAGVGVGTVFRRFPTKDDLVAAVVLERMRALLDLGERALVRTQDDPWRVFSEWFVGAVELHVRHRGLMETIASAHVSAPAFDAMRAEILGVVRQLVDRTIAAGALRRDIVAEDLPAVLCAISRTSCMTGSSCDPELWRRPCAIFLDGMRACE